MRTQRWVRTESGTRWQKNPEPAIPIRSKSVQISKVIGPLLAGEAQGDGVLAILLAVRNLLRTPEAFTVKARAVNSSRQSAEPASRDAVAWDIFGALDYVTEGVYSRKDKFDILQRIKQCIPKEDPERERLFEWQAAYSHSRVLWVLNMSVANRKRELGYIGKEGT